MCWVTGIQGRAHTVVSLGSIPVREGKITINYVCCDWFSYVDQQCNPSADKESRMRRNALYSVDSFPLACLIMLINALGLRKSVIKSLNTYVKLFLDTI